MQLQLHIIYTDLYRLMYIMQILNAGRTSKYL